MRKGVRARLSLSNAGLYHSTKEETRSGIAGMPAGEFHALYEVDPRGDLLYCRRCAKDIPRGQARIQFENTTGVLE